MHLPKLALCNFMPDVQTLRAAALAHGFAGIDWTFHEWDLPATPLEEARLIRALSSLHPLEVRYHCAFNGMDVGDVDPVKAQKAIELFRRVCRLVSRLNGRFMTVHLGLGRDSTVGLSWERTLLALSDLVSYGRNLRVQVCLENLAWGWSSRPELFEKLIRKSGAGVTLDIGHAWVCSSVQSSHYAVEDFVAPHPERVFNAHIYHEEQNDRHLPPQVVEDVADRLRLLGTLPCDWWVLELREERALMDTLGVIRRFFEEQAPGHSSHEITWRS